MILWNQKAIFRCHQIASVYPFEWHSNVWHLIDPFECHANSCKQNKALAFACARTTMQTPNSDWSKIAQRITNGLYWVIHSPLVANFLWSLLTKQFTCVLDEPDSCDQVSFLFLKELIFLCHVHGCRKLQIPFLFLITDSKIITFMMVHICPLNQVPASLLVLNTSLTQFFYSLYCRTENQ